MPNKKQTCENYFTCANMVKNPSKDIFCEGCEKVIQSDGLIMDAIPDNRLTYDTILDRGLKWAFKKSF